MIALTIAVCTFRRPHIVNTLASLATLKPIAGVEVRVLVIDNDDTPSARDRVEAQALPFPLTYRHVPGRNISVARNAALEAAGTRYLAFVDDDELVSASWLEHLWLTMIATRADVVLGPVDAVIDAAASPWIRNGGFHDTRPVFVNGKIVTGYSCNVLMDLEAPAIAGRRFRLDLGRSGGEDTEFFFAVTEAGGAIAYAPEAMIREPMPASRLSLEWLSRRRFRAGQTHALLLREHKRAWLAPSVLKACAKALFCGFGGVATLWSPVRWRRWYLRATLHVGAVSGLLGQRSGALYGGEAGQP